LRINKKNDFKSTILLLLTSLIWGLAFVAQRVGMEHVRTFTFNGVRFGLGALSLLPVILLFEKSPIDSKKKKTTLLAGLAGGAILFSASSLQQLGIEIGASAGKAGFITGLYTVIVPVLGIFLRRKASPLTWAGAMSAAVGMYFLSFSGGLSNVSKGDLVLFACAFFWAGHIIVIDWFVDGISPLWFSLTQFLSTSALSMICAFIFEDVSLSGIIAARVPIFYGGVFSVGIAYTLQTLGQKGVEPSKAAIIFSLESLFAALGGAVLLDEFLGAKGYLGCVFIFIGIILSQLRRKAPKEKDAGLPKKPIKPLPEQIC
jgi:drug/metabolite transporter (DMT)-like permease